ncbi:MAG TPA: hypothetical protein VN840_05955 [Streptosporangiaceae bacterium]|nr:hypothetical protein [Streptosporangiaceae bacterium]
MPGDASLARLFREYGDRWAIERVDRGTEWVAVRRDGELIDIIGARDLGALRYRIEAAEREEAED